MEVDTVPLTDFMHGGINAVQGRPVRMEESIAIDLERAGLLRIKMAPQARKSPDSEAAAGKALAAGGEQPLSSLLVAPASPTKTLSLSKTGAGRIGKTG